jgi:VanZ family protein
MTSLRFLSWCCVSLLAVLSLLPAQEMVRTGLPGRLEHFVAYAGSAAVAMAGYGASRRGVQIIGGFWVYAGILEYLQHFSPGRHPAIEDFAASALGALCGGLAIALLWRGAYPYSRPSPAASNSSTGLRNRSMMEGRKKVTIPASSDTPR